MSDMSISISDMETIMRTYPGTTIVDPSSLSPATREERRAEVDAFRIRDFKGEQLLFRPITATVMRTEMGDHPAVFTDAMVLTGTFTGKTFTNAPVFNHLVVDILTSVLDAPSTRVVAGTVSHHPVGSLGPTPAATLVSLSRESDIAHAAGQSSALGWDTDTPATDKELLGWNLTAARNSAKLTQADAAEMLRMSQPTLSAIESGARNVTAFELRDFARVYRTTMARLLP